jgi:hypothetical protein
MRRFSLSEDGAHCYLETDAGIGPMLRRVSCGRLCLEFHLHQAMLRLPYHHEDAVTTKTCMNKISFNSNP